MPLEEIRQRHIKLMQKTVDIVGNILKDVSQHEATTHRDGPDGWTVLEVVAHLRDFDRIFRERAELMLEDEYPELKEVDHDKLVVDEKYNEQNLTQVYIDLVKSRRETITFFSDLSRSQWERFGNHWERGDFSMTDAVIQVCTHEVNHIEQITRILSEARSEGLDI